MIAFGPAKVVVDTIKQDLASKVENWRDCAVEKIPTNVERLKSQLARFEKALKELTQAAVSENDIKDLQNHIAEYTLFTSNIEDSIADLVDRIPKVNKDFIPVENSGGGCSFNSTKLPTLELDTFDGNRLKFTAFWSSFSRRVDTKNIPTGDKFEYLRQSLVKEAGKCIAGLIFDDKNYERAKKILQDKYGDKSLQIDAHREAIMMLETCKNSTSALSDTYYKIEEHLNNLEILGDVTKFEEFLPLIKSKFPVDICVKIEESLLEDERLTLTIFRSKLLRLITIREKNERGVMRVEKEGKKESDTQGWRKDQKYVHKSPNYKAFSNFSNPTLNKSAVLTTTVSPRSSDRRPETPCIFCLGEHWNDDCDKVTSLEERKKKLGGRCFICLSGRHLSRDCESTRSCYHCGVTRSHHRSLCPQYVLRIQANLSLLNAEVTVEEEPEAERKLVAVVHAKCDTYVPAATAEISGSNAERFTKVKAILDTASQSSFITQALASRMKLKIMGYLRVELVGFGSVNGSATVCGFTEINLRVRGGVVLLKVIVVPHIANQHLTDWYFNRVAALRSEYPHIQINVPPKLGNFDLLVGIDYYYYVVGGRVMNVDRGMFLMETRLGFLLVGKKELDSHPARSQILSIQADKVCVCWPQKVDLSRFWELETLGLGSGLGDEQSEAVEAFYQSILLKDKRYFISWPWKVKPPSLPDNFSLAQRRLSTVLRQLRENKEVEAYDQIFKDQLRAGVIEEVSERNYNFEHYLPHMAVRRGDHRTTKLRVVFDASARARKAFRSLNDCLLKGRPLLEDLILILLRFRLHPVVLLADIEKAFLQLELREQMDKDAVRFLWLKNLNGNCDSDNLKIFRLARVAFGVVSSPFLLNAVIRHHVGSHLDRFPSLDDLHKAIYVDNLVLSIDNSDVAKQVYKDCKQLFNLASMNMREWVSNDSDVVKCFEQNDVPSEGTDCENVLGVTWNRMTDCLSLRVPSVGVGKVVSKRTALQFIAGVFDPFGFLAPSLLGGKLFMKDLWSLGLDWDEKLSLELMNEWNVIATIILDAVEKFKVPRCISVNEAVTRELHVFVDASASAYQANFYLRKVLADGTVDTRLLFTKNRITPANEGKSVKLTIPRLELLAACVGVKCLAMLREALGETGQAYVWSDSQCVLKWLESAKVLPLFEENRVREIRKVKNLKFRFVPGNLNPADIATRKVMNNEYLLDSVWWHGPEFLNLTKENWPLWNINVYQEAEVTVESSEEIKVNVNVCNPPNFNVRPPFELDFLQYEDLHNLLLDSVFEEEGDEPVDLDSKLLAWVRYVQEVYFSGERLNDEVRSKSKLRLGMDEGLLKVKGRMISSALTDDAKFPILLPRNCHLTNLIIKEVHEAGKHVGPHHTLALLSQRFFVPRGLAQVHRVLRNCTECKKASCGPYRLPDMPPLPKSRVTRSRPFSHIGLDGLGPFLVKDGPRLRKVWMLIITCLATRAIHLSLMEGLSAEEFLYCLREFIGRYNCPSTIVCDNALGFKSVALVSKNVWWTIIESDLVQNYVHSPVHRIEWKFIPEFAPFAGGVYERMVGLVKKCVTRTVFDVTYPKNLFRVFLCEVQGVLNARPLCPLDDGEYLTPSHFLSVPILVNGPFFDPETAGLARESQNVMQLWQKGYKLLDKFWRLWTSRYLIALGNRRTWRVKQNRIVSNVKPKVGENVLIGDRLPRARWLAGKIVSLESSVDGEIRTATVETRDGTRYRRSVGMLYPYEAELVDIRNLVTEASDGEDEGEEGGGEGLASPVPGSDEGGSSGEFMAARIVRRRQPVEVDSRSGSLGSPGVLLAHGEESERSGVEPVSSGVRMDISGEESGDGGQSGENLGN